jgi:hypothetical protein
LDSTPSLTALSVPLAKPQSQNFAPLKPIADAIQNKKLNKQPTKFEQGVRELYQHRLNHEKQAWNEMTSMAQLVSLFRKGNQLLVRRPFGAPGWYVRPVPQDDTTMRQTAMNFMGFYSQACESKVIASNPTVNMRAGDDTPEAIAAAQACRPIVDYYETEWYTVPFSRREAIRFLTDGMVIHQVRWNPFLGGYEVNERSVSKKDVTIDPGGGQCLDCPYEGDAESFQGQNYPQCPQCGSPAVDVRQPITQSIAQIGIGESKPVGEPEIISSSFMSWRWDLTKDLEKSSWAIKRQYVTQGAIKLMLGDVTIPDSQSSEQYGLDVMYALAYSGQAFAGSSLASQYYSRTSLIDKKPTLAEFWLSPEDQAMIECEEFTTVSGETIPAGRLDQITKGKPACIVGLNDMALIVGGYCDESHQREVITAQWFMDADSGAGRGLEDTVAVQKRFNAVDAQVYQGLATTATPAVITDMSLLKEDQGRYLFAPGHNIDISLALLPPNMKLQDAFYVGNPGTVSQQYIQYGSQFLREMAQISSLVTEFTNGLIGVDNRTATGAQITAQLANSLYGPMLASKGQMRVEIAKRIVSLVGAHDVAGRYYPGKGAAKGRMVSGQDLKGKVVFELVQNSQLPVTPFTQQTDVRVFNELFGGNPLLAAQLKQQFPEFFRSMAKPFNIDWGPEDDDEVSNRCLERLEQMKQNLMAGVDDPNMLVQMLRPPVSKIEPKHKEKAEWFSTWLDLDSAQNVPQELRIAAENMYWLHMNLDAQKQMPQAAMQGLTAGIGQAASAAPAALGAQALGMGGGGNGQDQAAEQSHEAQQNEADRSQADAHKAADLQKELALEQMRGQTQRDVTQIQGENAAETARIAGDNAVRAARAKPHPKTTKAA